jgi:mRNA interferase HicA
VKRRELIRRLEAVARERGACLTLAREGGAHTVYVVGAVRIVVPRHREINELTARGIIDDVRRGLG